MSLFATVRGEYTSTEAAQAARETQSKQGKKVVAHARGGPIYVQEARATMRTREELEIEKDNRFLVREWQAEAAQQELNRLNTEAVIARAAGRITEFYNDLISNDSMQLYRSLRPQGTVETFDNEFDDFNTSEMEELEDALS
jgi:hypothetical protein